ncbi:MAG: Fic family protein [Bacteroidales bacterium]|jgi:Fic family protein|nr:Fic family protein [Bacteroidales bacterium]
MTKIENFNKVDTLKNQLLRLQPLKPQDEQRLWKKFRLEWNFNSNHLEGNTLTYGHTELLLIFDKISGDYSGREIEEMKAHDVAIKMVVDLSQDNERDLTESFIRQLNAILLVRPFWKEAITPDGQPTRKEIIPGSYKQTSNSVRLENGEIFHYASPEDTPILMKDLMDFYRAQSADSKVHPLRLAAMMHYKFVRIHPFDDGNGRVARLLTNYVLLKNGFPPIIIKDSEKKEYLMALNKADTGDLDAFVRYIENQLLWSLEISIKAANGESIEEIGDLDKKVQLLKKSLKAKNKIVLKSKNSVERIINDVYIKYLKALEIELNRFKSLFKSSDWFYNKGATTAINTFPVSPFAVDKFENIIQHLIGFAKNGSESKYEVRLFLNRFNDEDDSFNIHMICDIVFEQRYFNIKMLIGPKEIDEKIVRSLVLISDPEFSKKIKKIAFEKNKYNDIYSEEFIKTWAVNVANSLFDYMETQANELELRRKKL